MLAPWLQFGGKVFGEEAYASGKNQIPDGALTAEGALIYDENRSGD